MNIPDISGIETDEARSRALAEAFEAMREALQRMVKAHRELMPCIKYGSVPDYAIQNEAPIEARAALALADKVKP